jgi:isopentenyl-diphosphate Delta-isomerase
MSEELFDVVDTDDRPLWVAPRSEVHAQRWLHRAVHIFVFHPSGKLLIHRRSATKDEYPLRWTSSASGHLNAGEDYLPAAHRELFEELGLRGDLELLHKFPATVETSQEHSVLYRLTTAAEPQYDPGEIESGGYFALDEIAAWIGQRPEEFTPCFVTLFRWYRAQFGPTTDDQP